MEDIVQLQKRSAVRALQRNEKVRPPEGGWGWMVAIGMALMFVSTTGQYVSFGLLFEDLLTNLGAQSTGATVIMNVLSASVNFTGLFTNYLLKSMTYRMVAVIGGMLFTVGIMLTTIAHNVTQIVITYSIISGMGLGLVAPSSYLAFNSFFLQRRGLVMGVCQAAIGLGFIAAPIVVQILLDQYGFRGTMLLLAGIALNSLVGAVLYQPVEWHQKKMQTLIASSIDESRTPQAVNGTGAINVEPELQMDVVPEEEDDLSAPPLATKLDQNHTNNFTQVSLADTECDEHVVISRRGSLVMSAMLDSRAHHLLLLPLDEEDAENGLLCSHSESQGPEYRQVRRPPSVSLTNFASNVLTFDSLMANTDTLSPNQQMLQLLRRRSKGLISRNSLTNDQHHWSLLGGIPDDETDGSNCTPQPPVSKFKHYFLKISNFLELELLQDTTYLIIVLGLSASFASDANFFTLMPFFLQSQGLGRSDVAMCLSIAAGADVVSRLMLPWLVAAFNLTARTAYLLGCITSAIARSVFVSVEGTSALAVMSGIVGFFRGALIVHLSLTIAEHCTLERFAAAYSLYMVINGVTIITLGPLIGVLRDSTGSFPLCIHILSSVLLLCAATWLCHAYFFKLRNKGSKILR